MTSTWPHNLSSLELFTCSLSVWNYFYFNAPLGLAESYLCSSLRLDGHVLLQEILLDFPVLGEGPILSVTCVSSYFSTYYYVQGLLVYLLVSSLTEHMLVTIVCTPNVWVWCIIGARCIFN